MVLRTIAKEMAKLFIVLPAIYYLDTLDKTLTNILIKNAKGLREAGIEKSYQGFQH